MNLKYNEYLLLNQEGIFPGPGESEEEFGLRVARLRTPIPLPGCPLSQEDWEEAHHLTQPLFDMKPAWVPAFYQDKKLSFWEAAAVWDCEGRTVVQLRKRFAHGRWGFVRRAEVLAHEAAHASRMAFQENRFEEVISYQTSRLAWRRWLGPLFRHPWEAVLCVFAAAIGWMLGILGALALALILPWVPFFFFLIRLSRDQFIFHRCLVKLRSLLNNPEHALAVVLRLTDREIILFSRADKEEITAYVREQQELRWKIISSYFYA